MKGIAVLGHPAEGNYHFEDEFCQISCGTDANGIEYVASHDVLVCHDHNWVTKTFQPAAPTCTAKPCTSYPSAAAQTIPNTEFECFPTTLITGSKCEQNSNMKSL